MKFTKLFAFAAIIITLGFASLSAANQRNVLVEEYTNASCGPCATQNPDYEAFIMPKTSDRIIPIAFHTQGPGRDSMFDANSSMYLGRQSYYDLPGVPSILVDGVFPTIVDPNYYKGAPGDTAAVNNFINKDIPNMSPYFVEVQQTADETGKVTVTVNVTCDNAVSGGVKLRIVMAEGWHYFTNAGLNGEKDFFYIARDMFPNYNGSELTLNAHETKTFTYDYTPNPAIINSPLLYAVAFVQDETTKEVLQAATSGVPSPVENTISVDTKYAKFTGNTAQTINITVSNNGSNNIESNLSASMIAMPQGWTAALSTTSLTIPAKGNAKATLTITPTSTSGGFGWVSITASPKMNYGIPISASTLAGRLSDKTKYLLTYGLDNMAGYPLSLIASYFGTNDPYFGIVPTWDEDFQNIVDFTDYKLIFLSADYGSCQYLATSSTAGDKLIANLDNYVKAGKSLFLTNEALLNFTNQTGNAKVLNFMRNTLGLQFNKYTPLIVNNTLQRMTATSTSDPLVTGINTTTNTQYDANFPYYCSTYESYTTNPQFSGTVTPLFTTLYNGTAENIALKIENNNSKAVVFGFGLQAFIQTATAVTVTKKIVDWLLKPATSNNAVIATDKSSYQFPDAEINKSKNLTINIQNTGSTSLNISTMSIDGDADGVFSLITSQSDFSIDAGSSFQAIIKFSPKTQKTYNAQFSINSDASNTNKLTVAISGVGVPETGVSDDISGDASKLTLAIAPNPVSTNSNITFTLGGDIQKFVKLNLVDESGRVISTVFSGMANPGVNIVSLNASAISSGKYFLIGDVDGYAAQLSVNVVK